jgi:signal transduction histidine kinase
MRGLSKWVVAVWTVAFALLVLNAAVSIYNVDVLIANDRAVAHSRDISRSLVELLSAMKDAETGVRGFIISERVDYLEPFDDGERAIPAYLEKLTELTSEDEFHRDHLDILKPLIEATVASLRRIVQLHHQGGEDAARSEIRGGKGKFLMDQVRAVVAEMEGHEQETLKRRSEVASARYQSSTFTVLLGSVVTVLMVAMAFLLVRLEFARRRHAEVAARESAFQLAEEQRKQTEMLAKMVRIRTAELESANQLLRDEVAERTRAEAQVQAATIELTRSNEELEKFAYVASHDLQEPLRKIQAFGGRLVKKFRNALGPDGGEYVERMQFAATRMRTLIDDLLTFSRVTTKGQPFRPVNLATIIREVIDDLGEQIEQASAQIDVGNLPTTEADPLQMRQLFQNLIGNALKFRKADSASAITIRSVAWEQLPPEPDPPRPAGQGFRIAVADNGIGFDQAFADRVFELFQRLHGRGHYEGTGIGLAICRKILQRHGGTISARSREGEGATFIIDLPATPVTLARVGDDTSVQEG